jgi:hypothetical protein
MENIEALTLTLVLIAVGLGIVAAHILPLGQVVAAITVAFYCLFMFFSPLTSAWFANVLVGQFGMEQSAFEISGWMFAVFAAATAVTIAYNVVTGRANTGLPPAV